MRSSSISSIACSLRRPENRTTNRRLTPRSISSEWSPLSRISPASFNWHCDCLSNNQEYSRTGLTYEVSQIAQLGRLLKLKVVADRRLTVVMRHSPWQGGGVRPNARERVAEPGGRLGTAPPTGGPSFAAPPRR